MMRTIVSVVLLLITANSEWIRTDENVVENQDFVLRFRLKAKDPFALEKALRFASEPGSPGFREYLSREEIEELVRPEVDLQYTKDVISSMFPDSVISFSLHREYVMVSNVSPSDISRVFPEITLSVYRHSIFTNHTIVRSSDPTQKPIPSELKSFVTTISGLSEKFPIKSPRKRLGSDPGVKVTPPIIWKQYNMTDKDVGGKTSTSQGVAAFEDAEFRPQDVSAFQDAYDIPEIKFQVIGPNGTLLKREAISINKSLVQTQTEDTSEKQDWILSTSQLQVEAYPPGSCLMNSLICSHFANSF